MDAKVRTEQVEALAARGLTQREAAAQLGMPYFRFRSWLKRHGVKYQQAKVLCSCGLRVARGPGAARHVPGVVHKHSERIRALLATNCLTLDEIGKRLGITRERVRQIANKLNAGFDGQGRRKVCTLIKRTNRAQQPPRTHDGLRARIQSLQDQGALVVSGSKNGLRTKTTYINGYKCRLSISRVKASLSVKTKSRARYYRFGLQDRKFDYALLYLTIEDVAYIVPRDWLPKSTAFIPRGRIEGYRGHHQRDWEQWRERWDLLDPIQIEADEQH